VSRIIDDLLDLSRIESEEAPTTTLTTLGLAQMAARVDSLRDYYIFPRAPASENCCEAKGLVE